VRRAMVGGAVAAAMLTVAACGGGDDAAAPKRPRDPVLDASRATEAAGGARMTGTEVVTVGNRQFTLPVRGAADFAHRRVRMSVGLPSGSARVRSSFRKAGFPNEEIWSGTLFWHRDTSLARKLPGGKEWAMIDRAAIGDAIGIDIRPSVDIDTRNPAKLLRYLRGPGGARKAGTERIGGVATTHYRAILDVRDALRRSAKGPAAVSNVDRVMQISQLPARMPVEMWVDAGGLIRRHRVTVALASGARSVITENYSGFSRSVRVNTPPASDVVDATDEAAQRVKRQLKR
jgi:hypothetical protein